MVTLISVISRRGPSGRGLSNSIIMIPISTSAAPRSRAGRQRSPRTGSLREPIPNRVAPRAHRRLGCEEDCCPQLVDADGEPREDRDGYRASDADCPDVDAGDEAAPRQCL